MRNKKGIVSGLLGALVILIIAGSLFVGCKQPAKSSSSSGTGSGALVDFDGYVKELKAKAVTAENEVQASMADFETKLAAYSGSDKTAIDTAYKAFKDAYNNDPTKVEEKAQALSDLLNSCANNEIKQAGLAVFDKGEVAFSLKYFSTRLEGIKAPLADVRKVVKEKGDDKIQSAWAKMEQAYFKMVNMEINSMVTGSDPSSSEQEALEEEMETAQIELGKAFETNATAEAEIQPKLEALMKAFEEVFR